MSAKPLSIVFFIESGGPGGAEQVVVALARGFREQGADTAVATLRTGWLSESLEAAGIPHLQLPSTSRFDIGLARRLAAYCKERQADVLHSHLLDSNFYGALAARYGRLPHLGTEHGDVHHTNAKKFARLKLYTLRLLGTKISAVSHFTEQRLQELGLPKEQTVCIGNPLPTTAHPTRKREEVRRSLGITQPPEEHWLWLHVANLRPVKDQGTLLRGFAEALSRHDRSQSLVLLGDGGERTALEELVNELGISENVHFLGFRNDVADYLGAADGFVLSSRSEALPMSLLEAGAAGLLLVSSAVGGVGDIIIPGETGMLYPAGDVAKLASALCDALNNTEQSELLRSQGKEHIERHYSLQAVLNAYRAQYAELGAAVV